MSERIVVPDYSDLPVWPQRGRHFGRRYRAQLLRVRRWLTLGSMNPKDIHVDRLKQIVFAYDAADTEHWSTVHLRFADIINGRPYAIFNGIRIVVALINGARGGLKVVTAEQQDKIWNQCALYYAKWAREMPERVAKKTISISLDQELVEHMTDEDLSKLMRDQMTAALQPPEEAIAVLDSLAVEDEHHMGLDLDEQAMAEIAAQEQELEHAQERLLHFTQVSERVGVESYRSDIAQWRNQVEQLQELLGIEPQIATEA